MAWHKAGRGPKPTVAVIDSPNVKMTESGGPYGYDAGKKIKGCMRHIVVGAVGFPITIHVHTTVIQDRDGSTGSNPGLAGRGTDGYEAVC